MADNQNWEDEAWDEEEALDDEDEETIKKYAPKNKEETPSSDAVLNYYAQQKPEQDEDLTDEDLDVISKYAKPATPKTKEEAFYEKEEKEEPSWTDRVIQAGAKVPGIKQGLEWFAENANIRTDPTELRQSLHKMIPANQRFEMDRRAFESLPGVRPGEVTKDNPRVKQALEKYILPSEVAAIAKKHGIPVEEISNMSSFFGAPELRETWMNSFFGSPEGDLRQRFGGDLNKISEVFLFGLPQKWFIDAQRDPKKKAALEDLRTLALDKKPGAAVVSELAANVVLGIGVAGAAGKIATKAAGKTVGKVAETTAAIGESAAASYAESEQGKEKQALELGATLGTIFPLITETSKYLKDAGARKLAQQVEKEVAESPDTVAILRKELESQKNGLNLVDKVIDNAVKMDENQAVEFSNLLNSVDGIQKLVGGPEQMSALSQEIMAKFAPDTQRKILSDLKDARLIKKDGTILPAGNASIIQRYLDIQLSRTAEQLGETATSITEALQTLVRRSGEGADFLKTTTRNAAEKAVAEQLVAQKMLKKLNPSDDNTVAQWLFQSIVDAQFVFREIDRKAGLRTEVALNTMNYQNNAYTRFLGYVANGRKIVDKKGNVVKVVPGLKQLAEAREAAKLDFDTLYKILDNPQAYAGKLNKEQELAVKSYQDFFAYNRKKANKMGLNIQDFTQVQGGYVPHMVKEPVELARRMRDSVKSIKDEFKINLLDYTKDQYLAAEKAGLFKSAAYKQMKESLGYLSGKAIKTQEEFTESLFAQINPRTAGIKRASTAAATYRRSVENVPEMIRETNVDKLASRWARDTFRHAFLRDSFAEMEKTRDILIARGFKKDAEYMTNWLTDNLGGTRPKTWRAATQEMSKWVLDVRDNAKADSQLRRIADWTLETGPEVVPKIYNAVYTNFLGFNVPAAMQNMSQSILMTAPEIGVVDGQKYVARALANIAKDPKGTAAHGTKFRPAQFNTELLPFLEAGLNQGAVAAGFSKLERKYTQVAMAMYEGAERATRIIVAQMGKELAKDIIEKTATGNKFLMNLNPGMRKEVMEALASKDTAKVERLISNNLMDKTVFQYNKLSMSAFGRAAGPVLAVFSKWPTAIAGDIADVLKRKGIKEGTANLGQKYLAPYAMLAVLNYAATGGESAFEQPDTRVQGIIGGKKGLSSLSPVGTIASMLEPERGIATPPAMVGAKRFLQGALNADVDYMARAAASMGDAYVPMLPSLLRTWNNASKIITGDEAEYRSLESIYQENFAD